MEKNELGKQIKEMNDGVQVVGKIAVDFSSIVFVLLTRFPKEKALQIIQKDFQNEKMRNVYSGAITKYWDELDQAFKKLPADGLK